MNCAPRNSCCHTDAKCVIYTGQSLSCTNIRTGDRLDTILGKLNNVICLLKNTEGGVPQRIQFIVGNAPSLLTSGIPITVPSDGDTQLVINVTGIIDDSLEVYMDGIILPRDLTDRSSYGVVYEPTRAIINMFPQFSTDNLFIIRYAYIS